MKYTTKIFGSILVMVLIMTLSSAQSMEMMTSVELPESVRPCILTKTKAA